MSKPNGNLYHPINNHPEAIYSGFSWPCLFFGFFWFLYKSMWGWAIGHIIAAMCSFGISNLVFPFIAIRIAPWQSRTLPKRKISKFSSTGWS